MDDMEDQFYFQLYRSSSYQASRQNLVITSKSKVVGPVQVMWATYRQDKNLHVWGGGVQRDAEKYDFVKSPKEKGHLKIT